jgi:hypothetical protein
MRRGGDIGRAAQTDPLLQQGLNRSFVTLSIDAPWPLSGIREGRRNLALAFGKQIEIRDGLSG